MHAASRISLRYHTITVKAPSTLRFEATLVFALKPRVNTDNKKIINGYLENESCYNLSGEKIFSSVTELVKTHFWFIKS